MSGGAAGSLLIDLLMAAASVAAILLTYLVTFGILGGVGVLVRRAFGLTEERADSDWFDAFWMGLAATVSFLMIWNFLFPVNAAAVAIVTTAGLFGIWMTRRRLGRLLTREGRPSTPLLLALIGAGLWLADLAMGPMVQWDSALYHLQAIKWAESYPVVPGVANLYGPLAFNNAGFLYGALMRAGPWGRYAHHVAGSTLIAVALAQGIVSGFALRREGAGNARRLLEFGVLAAVVTFITPEISGFSTDVAATVTSLAAAAVFCAFLTAPRPHSNERAYLVVTVTTLATLAVCFKFGTAVYAAALWVTVVALWMLQESAPLRWKPVLWSSGISSAMLLAWMARGVVQSGYPMFPNAFAAAPVDWRAPAEHARAELAFIVHSGRSTAHLLGSIPDIDRFAVWVPRWLQRLVFEAPFEILVPACLAAAGYAAYHAFRRRAVTPGRVNEGWLLLAPVVPAIVCWFLIAPEPRYAMHLFWIGAAACWIQAIRAARASVDADRLNRRVVLFGSLVAISPALVNPLMGIPRNVNPLITRSRQINVRPVGERTRVPVPPLDTFTTTSGLVLNVPHDAVGQCFDAPLPCTPNPALNLRLREPGNLARGFAVDGAWHMTRWPYDWLPHFLEAWRGIASRPR